MSGPLLVVGGHPEDWGIIPSFLDTDDPRRAIEQLDAHYIGGWRPFEGFTWDPDSETLSYPGDPPMKPKSMMLFRDEVIVIFDFAWVMVIQPDKSWEICRMD